MSQIAYETIFTLHTPSLIGSLDKRIFLLTNHQQVFMGLNDLREMACSR